MCYDTSNNQLFKNQTSNHVLHNTMSAPLIWNNHSSQYTMHLKTSNLISMVSCQKGPTCHAYAWQIGPFWQDTLDFITLLMHLPILSKLVPVEHAARDNIGARDIAIHHKRKEFVPSEWWQRYLLSKYHCYTCHLCYMCIMMAVKDS